MRTATDASLDEALLLQREIASLKHPEDRVTEAVKHYFEVPYHVLGGKAKTLFQREHTNDFSDLVALKSAGETDLLSNFLRRHWRGKVRSRTIELGQQKH